MVKLSVYKVAAPVMVINRTKKTFRWESLKTNLYVEGRYPLPLIRNQLDWDRARQLQNKLEAQVDDGSITEAWEELLRELTGLHIL